MTTPSHESGFTLLEVLVSFVILASAVIAGLRIFEEGLAVVRAAQDRSAAVAVAENILARVQLSEAVRLGHSEGRDAGFGWSSDLSARGWGEPQSGAALPVHVHIRIFKEGAGTALVTLETDLIVPVGADR